MKAEEIEKFNKWAKKQSKARLIELLKDSLENTNKAIELNNRLFNNWLEESNIVTKLLKRDLVNKIITTAMGIGLIICLGVIFQ